MRRALLLQVLASLGLGMAAGSAAATACSVSVSVMPFGIYDTVAAAANDTSASVQVSCAPGVSDPLATAYVLTIAGTGSGSDSVRSVSAGAYRLYFQVYRDGARSTVWGNGGSSGPGVASSVTAAAALTLALRVHTAYARMPALQTVPPGLYAGSLMVTVEY